MSTNEGRVMKAEGECDSNGAPGTGQASVGSLGRETLRILVVEDSQRDAELIVRSLETGGYAVVFQRVETAADMDAALGTEVWDAVISDYRMPSFDGLAALHVLQEKGIDIPFLVVSGTIGEETAVAAMRAGAHDYLMKDNLARLAPALERELREAESRRDRRRLEEATREAARQWRATFDAMNDAICLMDLEGKIQRCNTAFQQLVGKRFPEIIGRPCWEVVHGASEPVMDCPFVAMKQSRTREIRIVEHHERWLSGNVDPLLDEAGSLLGAVHVLADITESQRAQKALRDTNEYLDNLFKHANASIIVWDPQLNITRFNHAFESLTGRSAQEVIGHSLEILFPPPLVERSMELIKKTLAGERLETVEIAIQHRNGSVRTLLWNSATLIALDGAPMATIAQGHDITERKQAEQALRESERRFRELSESLPQLVWTCRGDGTCDYLGPQWVEYTGIPEAEQLGFAWLEQVHPDDRDRTVAAWYAAVDGNKPFEIEFRIRRNDGIYRWFATHAAAFRSGEGRIVKWFGTNTDVDDQRGMEEALRTSLAYARSLIEASLDPLVTISAEGKITDVNEASVLAIGVPREKLIGTDFSDYFADPAKAREGYRQVFLEGFVRDYPLAIRHVSGRVTDVLYNASVYRDARGDVLGVFAAARDITERKRAEEEKLALEAHLRHQQRLESIGTLASGVAHEINNPIHGIMNYAQLIVDKSGLDPRLAEFAREILHETERVANIVSNLLTFSRQEKQTHSPARLTDIVESTLSLIGAVMRHDQIALQVDVPADLPRILCRSQQIQQVLMNFMTNARDALNEKYPGYDAEKVLHIMARTFEKSGDRWIRLTVEDHGTGIPLGIRERVFDPFFTTKPKDKGTGIGLSISHGIVKEHHGELHLESETGRYTRFHMDLPVMRGAGEPQGGSS